MSLGKVRALIDLGRWPEALDELAPHCADPAAGVEEWALMARTRLGLGDAAGAAEAARTAIARAPDSEVGHRLLAIALMNQRFKQREAIASARRAVALESDSEFTLFVLGVALSAGFKAREARAVIARNLELNPLSLIALRAAAKQALNGSDYPEAEEVARRGLALDPQDDDLMLVLSQAVAKQGRTAEAADHAVSAIRSAPQNPQGRRQLERILAPGLGIGAAILLLVLVQVIRAAIPDDWYESRAFQVSLFAVAAVILPFLVVAGVRDSRRNRAELAAMSPQLQALTRNRRREQMRRPLLGVTIALLAMAAMLVAVDWRFGVPAVVAAGAALAAVVRFTPSPRPRR